VCGCCCVVCVGNALSDLGSKGIVCARTVQRPGKEVAWNEPNHIPSLEVWCFQLLCTLIYSAVVLYPLFDMNILSVKIDCELC
jgi:hypothetical protein